MTDVIVITGSPSEHSRSAALAAEVAQLFEARGVASRLIDIKQLPAEDLLHANFNSPAIRQAVSAVVASSLLVIATPIYKVAYSGLLKAFLDLLPQDGLSGKSVISIASGGSIAHLLALDYSLRPVLASLGVQAVIGNVYAVDSQLKRCEEGAYTIHEEVLERLRSAVDSGCGVLHKRELTTIS